MIKDKYKVLTEEAGNFKKFVFEKWSIAIALIVALAAKNLVSSLVENLITPVLSFVITGKGVYQWSYQINDTTVVRYGKFFEELTTFILLMLIVYIASKILNKKKEESNS